MGTNPTATLSTEIQCKSDSGMDDWLKWSHNVDAKKWRRLWQLLLDTLIDVHSSLSSNPYSELSHQTIRNVRGIILSRTRSLQTDVVHTLLYLQALCLISGREPWCLDCFHVLHYMPSSSTVKLEFQINCEVCFLFSLFDRCTPDGDCFECFLLCVTHWW